MFFTTQLQETYPNLISWCKGSARLNASMPLPIAAATTTAKLWQNNILVRFRFHPQTQSKQCKKKLFAAMQILHHPLLPSLKVIR